MKTTPGPWHWEADPVKNDPRDRIRYQVTALGKTVTRVYYSSYEGGPTTAEGDAKLIAAAPDMYEALEMALKVIDNLGPCFTAEFIRAALKKAEGL